MGTGKFIAGLTYPPREIGILLVASCCIETGDKRQPYRPLGSHLVFTLTLPYLTYLGVHSDGFNMQHPQKLKVYVYVTLFYFWNRVQC